MKSFLVILLTSSVIFSSPVWAEAKVDETFGGEKIEGRFRLFVKDIRCMVCQNQTLLSSKAPLAVDLRREIVSMMQQGKTDKEIVDFLVARYGDFVLYKPPLKASTVFLWFGPPLLLLIGLIVVIRMVSQRNKLVAQGLSPAERDKVKALLAEKDAEE